MKVPKGRLLSGIVKKLRATHPAYEWQESNKSPLQQN